MPRKPAMKITGLNGAQAMTMELEVLTGTNSGATWIANEKREPIFDESVAPTHSEVIDHLAKGGRDISPNEKDAEKSGSMITKSISAQLAKTGRETPDGSKKPVTPSEKRAKAGLAQGLRAAAKYNSSQMTNRVETMTTKHGAPARKVSDGYAERRKKFYNVDKSVVFVASTQLANALIKGDVEIFLTDADVSRFT